MKGILIRRISLVLMLFILSFVSECIIIGIIFKKFYANYFMIEFLSYFIFLFPILLFKSERITVIYASIYFTLMLLLLIANLTLDYSSNDIFSIRYIIFINTVTNVFSFNFINWWYLFIYGGFIIFYVLFMVFVYRKIPHNPIYIAKAQAIGGIISCILLISFFGIRDAEIRQYKSDNKVEALEKFDGYELATFTSSVLKNSVVKDLGLLNYYLFEINYLMTPNNFDLSADDSVYEMNEYTGSLSNMNVLEIMIETGSTVGVSQTLTPNLYHIMYNSVEVNRSYTKNKTNVSEFIGINGSTEQTISSSGYDNPYSLAKVLSKNGYVTTYLHDNYSSFYNRDEIIKKAGFENTIFHPDNEEWGSFTDGTYPFDLDFVNKNIDSIIPNTSSPFYTFWTTLSTHGPYNESSDNKAFFTTTEYSDTGMTYYNYLLKAENDGTWYNPLKEYTGPDKDYVLAQMRDFECKLMNFDLALGVIINKLKEEGLYDNTLIVLYGDHDIYYESNGCAPLDDYIYSINKKIEDGEVEQSKSYSPKYKTILCFSNPKLAYEYNKNEGNLVYDYFASTYCIVPTILDLLGIDFSYSNYIGKSIFSSESDFDNLFYSHELHIYFTDIACASGFNELDYENCDEEYKEEFFKAANNLIVKISQFNKKYEDNSFEG